MSSALQRAISERRPVRSLGDQTPFDGLRRRHIGTWDVTAQSFAAVAPAAVVLSSPIITGARSGAYTLIELAITVALVILLAAAIGVFARRMASTGSLYTFVARGIGWVPGIVAGGALGIGYASIAMNTLTSGSIRVVSMFEHAAGRELPGPLIAVVIAAAAVVLAVIAAVGLRVSTRVMLVIELTALAAIVAVSVVVLSATGWHLEHLLPGPDDAFDPTAVLGGVAIAMIAFVGFESGTALGPESRRPLATVPRSLAWTVAAISLVYLLGSTAQLSAVATLPEGETVRLAPLVDSLGFDALGPLVDLVIALSYLACAFASTIALARLAFAMSKEGLLPGLFGRVSPRSGTPVVSTTILLAVIAAVPILLIAITGDPGVMRPVTSTTSVAGYVTAYLLVCVAAPMLLRRIGEFTWREAVPAVMGGVALAGVLAAWAWHRSHVEPLAMLIGLTIVGVCVAALLVRAVRRGDAHERIGVHDRPIAADSIGGRPEAPGADEPGAPGASTERPRGGDRDERTL